MTSYYKLFSNKVTKNTFKSSWKVFKNLPDKDLVTTFRISHIFVTDKHISKEFFASEILLDKNVLCTIIDNYGHLLFNFVLDLYQTFIYNISRWITFTKFVCFVQCKVTRLFLPILQSLVNAQNPTWHSTILIMNIKRK